MSKKLKITALTLFGVAAMLMLSGCSTQTGVDSTPAEKSASAEEEPANAVPGIGDVVVDDSIEFVVNSVTCTTEPMEDGNFAALDPKGQFCKVNVSATALKNIGMFLGKITITTDQISGEVTPAIGAMMYAGALTADYIDEGQMLTGDIVFDIAVDDSVATVHLKKNAMSSGVVVEVG